MPYTIEFKKSAFKELEKLPVLIQQNITSNIAGLALNPRPNGCKKLKGRDNHWRIRLSDYRIVYTIEDNILMVEIIRVGHRSDVYE